MLSANASLLSLFSWKYLNSWHIFTYSKAASLLARKSKNNPELSRARQSCSRQPASRVWAGGAALLSTRTHPSGNFNTDINLLFHQEICPVGLPWIQGVWFQQLLDSENVKPSSISIHSQKPKIQDLLAVGLRSGDPQTLDLNRSGKGGQARVTSLL